MPLRSTQRSSRDTLRTRIQIFLDKWEPVLGVSPREWDVRKMKSYWASVNERDRLITFNEKLSAKPDSFLEVLVVHELVHFLTDGHDRRFYELMDRHVPGWRRLHERHADPLLRHN